MYVYIYIYVYIFISLSLYIYIYTYYLCIYTKHMPRAKVGVSLSFGLGTWSTSAPFKKAASTAVSYTQSK